MDEAMKVWNNWKEALNDFAWFGFGASAMLVILLLVGLYYLPR